MERYLSTKMHQYGDAQAPTFIHAGEEVWVRRKDTGKYEDWRWRVYLTKEEASAGVEPVAELTKQEFEDGYTKPIGRSVYGVLTVAEACELLGVQKARVGQLLDGGHLAARKAGGTWLIDKYSVQLRKAYQEQEKPKPRSVDITEAMGGQKTLDALNEMFGKTKGARKMK